MRKRTNTDPLWALHTVVTIGFDCVIGQESSQQENFIASEANHPNWSWTKGTRILKFISKLDSFKK